MFRLLMGILFGFAIMASPLSAQRTGYQSANMWGGYKDKEVKPGIFRVVAKVNKPSGGARRAYAIAHYRAAEVIKNNGFAYLRILKLKHSEIVMRGMKPTGTNFGKTHLWVRGASGPDDEVGCDMKGDRADLCETVGVDDLMDRFRRMIDFDIY